MTLEQSLTAAVEQAVRRAVEPLRLQLEKLRAEQQAEAVSVKEAARRLGVSARTIQRMIKRVSFHRSASAVRAAFRSTPCSRCPQRYRASPAARARSSFRPMAKRRTRGTGEVFQENGTWSVRWREGQRRCYRGGFESKALADRVLARIRGELAIRRAGLPPDPKAVPTLAELAEDFLERRKLTHRAAVEDRYR